MKNVQSINAPPIAGHRYPFGIVGNCNFSALIDHHAIIRWLCWPRFDSSFIFGSLLDEEKGGLFSICPKEKEFTSRQYYVENTNILTTHFETSDGEFEVIDFAPRFLLNERLHRPTMLFRKIRKISGFPRLKIVCRPVGGYGELTPVVGSGSHHIRYEGLGEPMRLTTNASITLVREERDFTLTDDLYLVLSWGIPLEGPLESTFEDFYTRTKKYWRAWVERCTLPKVYQAEVIRSALTLKLHQFEDTGGIIAACTTSLPETPGENRNWDYRYCWLRDSYYTVSAFNSIGHFDEMEKYSHFIENLNYSKLRKLQPVYCVNGSSKMPEKELNLKGYMRNQPVRIGNAAADQVQYDSFGQILLTLFSLYTDRRLIDRDRLSPQTLWTLLEGIESHMDSPDNGLWEFRGKKSLHSYTLLFHWAGSAACFRIAQQMNEKSMMERALKTKHAAEERLERCYSKGKKAYAQAVDSAELDSSLLQMVTLGFFEDKDPQMALDHVRAIRKELETSPGFLLRYQHQDDFGHQSTSFLVCGFWLVESLLYLGEVDEAQKLFEKILETRNHLGLLSEGFDPGKNSQWGNFPQTYSHVGLINCAFAIDRSLKKPGFL